MSDWITDRLPAREDADAKGRVLCVFPASGTVDFAYPKAVKAGQAWQPTPKPPEATECKPEKPNK